MIQPQHAVELRRRGCIWLTMFPSVADRDAARRTRARSGDAAARARTGDLVARLSPGARPPSLDAVAGRGGPARRRSARQARRRGDEREQDHRRAVAARAAPRPVGGRVGDVRARARAVGPGARVLRVAGARPRRCSSVSRIFRRSTGCARSASSRRRSARRRCRCCSRACRRPRSTRSSRCCS